MKRTKKTLEALYQNIMGLGLDATYMTSYIIVNRAEYTFLIMKDIDGYDVITKNYNTEEEYSEFFTEKNDVLDIVKYA